MKIDILTIFPEMFTSAFAESIIKRAIDEQKVEIRIHNLRNWAQDNYKTVDDRPYGGGAGMIMKVDVIDRAVESLKEKTDSLSNGKDSEKVILLDTKGDFYTQSLAKKLAKTNHLILIAPHYEGIDHRVHEEIADEVFCIGPYVLTGGELPAMVIVDSIVRLIPEVIRAESLSEESFNEIEEEWGGREIPKKEYAQYTRPAEYKGWKVPEVLLNGNHKEIEKWRKEV